MNPYEVQCRFGSSNINDAWSGGGSQPSSTTDRINKTSGSRPATRRPLKLIHAEGFETRYEALTMERKLKGWSRAKKLAYMEGDWKAVGGLAKGKHWHQRMLRDASTPLAAQATLSVNGMGSSEAVLPERRPEGPESKGSQPRTPKSEGQQ